jgi:hypothetical protein
MNEGTQDPAQLEQIWLSNLEAQYQVVNKNLQAYLASPPFHSSGELASWASYMSAVESYFAQYKTMALYLKGLGFDQLFDRVEPVLAEIHAVAVAYAQMYKNALDSEGKMRAIGQETAQTWFDTMQRMMKTQQAAFDAANSQWEATFRGKP